MAAEDEMLDYEGVPDEGGQDDAQEGNMQFEDAEGNRQDGGSAEAGPPEEQMQEDVPKQDAGAGDGDPPPQEQAHGAQGAQAEAHRDQEQHDAAAGGQDPLAQPPHGTEVFISKIPREATDSQLRSFCEQCGEVYAIRLPKDPGNPGQNKGYAFAVYKTKEGATAALTQLNQGELADFTGRKVTIVRSEVKNKLFMGNLPREMTRDEIVEVLNTEVRGVEGMDLMMEKETGQNRGFGFVEFYNHAAAEAARRKLSRPDFRLRDRPVTVTWAEPKKSEALMEQVKSIYVGNLPETADEQKLRGIFSAYGKITGVSLLKEPSDPSKIRNYCFIHYEERASALKAVEEGEATKHEMEGKELVVHMAKPQMQRDDYSGDYGARGYGSGYGQQQGYGSRAGYGQQGGGRGAYGGGGGSGYGAGTGGYGSRAGTGTGSYRGGRAGASGAGGRGGYGAAGGARGGYGSGAGRGGGRGGGGGYGAGGGGYDDVGYDDYDGYGDEGYDNEGYAYSGYNMSAGMGVVPILMPGGQVAYVMAGGMGAGGAGTGAMAGMAAVPAAAAGGGGGNAGSGGGGGAVRRYSSGPMARAGSTGAAASNGYGQGAAAGGSSGYGAGARSSGYGAGGSGYGSGARGGRGYGASGGAGGSYGAGTARSGSAYGSSSAGDGGSYSAGSGGGGSYAAGYGGGGRGSASGHGRAGSRYAPY